MHPEGDVVVGLGNRVQPSELGELPPNVHAFLWAPQFRVLAHADCAVLHAGITSINECIYHGVPMLVYPFKKTTDQLGNAARVAYHGLGIAADRDTDDAITLRQRIETLLDDRTYQAQVDEMRRHFLRYQDGGTAVSVVENLLRRPASEPALSKFNGSE